MRHLQSYVSTEEQFLALSHAEVASIVLQAMSGDPSFSGNYHVQDLKFLPHPQADSEETRLALKEAWHWMLRELLLIPFDGDWCRPSRAAQSIIRTKHWALVTEQQQLQRNLLHELIRSEASELFLRGKYEMAVFYAMKELEIYVRDRSALSGNLVGTKLMQEAFKPDGGPLSDPSREGSERVAEMELFKSAMGAFRNATGHRRIDIAPSECAKILTFASLLFERVPERPFTA